MCKEDSYESRRAAREESWKAIHQDKSPSDLPPTAKKLVKALRALSGNEMHRVESVPATAEFWVQKPAQAITNVDHGHATVQAHTCRCSA